jgi:hypothetical protein
VTITDAGCTVFDTSWAHVVVSILTNTAVIVLICNRATTVVAVDAEHSVDGVVRDKGELVLLLLRLEVAETRLTNRKGLGRLGRGEDGEFLRASLKIGWAENGLQETEARLFGHSGLFGRCRGL